MGATARMSASWNDDFLDLLDCLAAEQVECLVVGAFALAIHGVPRATGDIDVFVRPSETNAERLMRALARFGAPLDAARVTATDFATPGIVYQMGVPPRRIDLLTEISGVAFEDAWRDRVTHSIEGRDVSFLGLDALLANKRASGRSKDLVDVEMLERMISRR